MASCIKGDWNPSAKRLAPGRTAQSPISTNVDGASRPNTLPLDGALLDSANSPIGARVADGSKLHEWDLRQNYSIDIRRSDKRMSISRLIASIERRAPLLTDVGSLSPVHRQRCDSAPCLVLVRSEPALAGQRSQKGTVRGRTRRARLLDSGGAPDLSVWLTSCRQSGGCAVPCTGCVIGSTRHIIKAELSGTSYWFA